MNRTFKTMINSLSGMRKIMPVAVFLMAVFPGMEAKAWYLEAGVEPGYTGTSVKDGFALYTTNGVASSNGVVRLNAGSTNPDYKFTEWYAPFGDEYQYYAGSSTSASIRVTSTNDTDVYIVAVFVNTALYDLTVNANNSAAGYTVPTGTVTDLPRNLYTIAAYVTNTAYVFSGWTGNGVEDPTLPSTRVMMDGDKTVTATFSPVLRYTGYDPYGPSSGSTIASISMNQIVTAAPLAQLVYVNEDLRQSCAGWTEGGGNIPPLGTAATYPFQATMASSNRWTWKNQYRVVINVTPGGIAFTQGQAVYSYSPLTLWVNEGTLLQVTQTAIRQDDVQYQFAGWRIGWEYQPSGDFSRIVTNAILLTGLFTPQGGDIDEDKLPDAWEREFGLSTSSKEGVDGPNGDPDGDRLTNIEEYLCTNSYRQASPINADSDGDGMDDYYEKYFIGGSTNYVDEKPEFISAVLDNGDLILNNGPLGNPDSDYKWSTENGYRLTKDPLRNEDEWRGPDMIDPCTYSNVTFGNTLYPFASDRSVTVTVMVANGIDTDDQSRGNMTDSEADGFDDGYEYTWDRWQQAFSGSNEVFVIGVTNREILTITNTIPVWDGKPSVTRRYNPRKKHVDPAGTTGLPDNDVLYDYLTGGVSTYWYSDVMEYNASATNVFSGGIDGAPQSIRRDQRPTSDDPPRCSHPFLMDADGDGLPDGYEVIFGYDPWTQFTSGSVGSDDRDNRDDDWMAIENTNNLAVLRHAEIYAAAEFDPRTGWAGTYPMPGDMPGPGGSASPNTGRYSNREEMWGPDGVMALAPRGSLINTDNASHPLKPDSDGDGIWDGWEGYMGLNPADPVDGRLDVDGDGLSNWQEFESFVTSSTNRLALTPLTNWLNKIFPTDIYNGNTDDDDLPDGAEQDIFQGGLLTSITSDVSIVSQVGTVTVTVVTQQVFTAFEWNGACYTAGGLNPTSWDTDSDTLPDPWEAEFQGGVNGTLSDTFADPDDDKLENYQEYMTAAVYHWQYDFWTDGLPAYNTRDFFQRVAKPWDWRPTDCGEPARYIPYLTPGGSINYSSTDPGNSDSDADGMDDYWEIYHGLCPVYGYYSLPASRLFPPPMVIIPDIFRFAPWTVGDPRDLPWVGTPENDPDGDGLHNGGEAVDYRNEDFSPTYHTDPTPLWITDLYYGRSWVNLYYRPGTYWPNAWAPYPKPDLRPAYMYDFEINEGFDTDNDNVGDYPELNGKYTDPVTTESPIKRRALYLPLGRDAYARTDPSYHFLVDKLRSFTVEAWVRPANPAMGQRQIVVERPLAVPIGNPLGGDENPRINFRLALDEAGVPYVEYTGEGDPVIFYTAKAASMTPLSSTNWTHLAGTYSVPIPGEQRGRLTLYVNGKMAQSVTPNELPAVGRFGNEGNIRLANAPFVIGAGDYVPYGTVIPRPFIPPLIPPPSPHSFFKGWIDEVRIWDGCRTQADVVAGMKRRMKQADVLTFANTPTKLYGLYTFDDLPDPDHSPVSPGGFDVVMMNNRPTDYVATMMWAGSSERSQRYTDYLYIPWIENSCAHIPERPAVDLGDPRRNTDIVYPNHSNPYNLRYFTAPDRIAQIHPLGDPYWYVAPTAANQPLFTDLLPLRWAEADEDIDMWDGGGAPAATAFDTDGDGLPDEWEETFGFDPLDPTGANGALGDLDGDGLTNFIEYRCGLNPTRGDSDGDGTPDKNEDSDGDFLINLQELTRGTLPDSKDTDDDGLTDWEEVTGFTDTNFVPRPDSTPKPVRPTDPLNPLEPSVPRSVYLDGNSRLIVPPSNKLMSENWTLEMWVRPDTNSEGGVLISRYVGGIHSGQSGINYELGLTTNAPAGQLRPYIKYSTTTSNLEAEVRLSGAESNALTDSAVSGTISNGVWTHVAGTYDSMSNSLALFINGKLATWRKDAIVLPPTVFGYAVDHDQDEVTIGASRSIGAVANGYKGHLDEVRVWSMARSAAQIAERYNAPEALLEDTASTITLKSRLVTAVGGLGADVLALPGSQRVHALVQFATKADAEAKSQLEAAGIKVLNYAGMQARVVTATREQLAALGDTVRWSGLLKPADKISAKLEVNGSHGARNMLVQFHKDVLQAVAVQAVETVGGAVYQGRYIGGTYLVATVNDAQAVALAADDGVAWIRPAADFLTSGRTVRLLPARTVGGLEVAPFTVVGNGWDGPGRGSADLTYYFVNDTGKMSPPTARAAVVAQMQKWSSVAAVTFSPTIQAGLSYSIDIGWYTAADDPELDGPGGTLGFGYYPNDINPEPIAGDFVLDEDEAWQIGIAGGGTDLEYVSLHEIGHCLGLGHSDDPNALMYPFYDGTRGAILAPDDIYAIQSIYGEALAAGTGLSAFRFDDGGMTAQDFSVAGDWLTGWASAARLDGAVFATNVAPVLNKDSDGDGMPDEWELAYGLDPYDTTGRNGAYGDIDSDGLANLYEYLAVTSPADPDSDNDGFSDYDSRNGEGVRTYGELYDDGDGIPDEWEILYRGPCPATGIRGLDPAYYDANLDPDRDGWSNYAEYMSRTDPLSAASYPTPLINMHLRYKGRLGNSIDDAIQRLAGGGNAGGAAGVAVSLSFYTTPAMDGYPDVLFTTTVSNNVVRNFANGYIREGNNYVFGYLDADGDGEWNPALEPAGIGQFHPINIGWGDINNVEIGLTDDMPGYPRVSWPAVPGAKTYAITNASAGGPVFARTMKVPRTFLHEGDYLYAKLYGMGSGSKTFQIRVDESPSVLTSMVVNLPTVTLSTPFILTAQDFTYQYARNEIEFVVDTNATAYRLQVALSTNASPVVSVTNIVPYRDNGVCKVTLPFYAGDNFVPTNASFASGTWTNGRYFVRVQAATLTLSSSLSPWRAINLNLKSPSLGGRSEIGGDLYYFGKVSKGYGPGQTNNLTMIVQAFESPGFSGTPEGQVQVNYSCNTNAPSVKKGDYLMRGLGNKMYYVRAFIDVNGNRTLDPFEPMGFAQRSTTETDYQPLPVDLSGQAGVARGGIRVVIRDRDTDDDQLPDGWEWMYYGHLDMGSGDIDAGSMTLLQKYAIEAFDLDPTIRDFDHDGLDDEFEVTYNEYVVARASNPGLTPAMWVASGLGDFDDYDPYPPRMYSEGTDLNPASVDTDGDGLGDGYEVFNGLDPLDPFGDADGDGITDAMEILVTRTSAVSASDSLKVRQVATVSPGFGLFSLTWAGKESVTYQVQYSDDLREWKDAPDGLFTGAAEHNYVEQSPSANVRFYRVVVK